MSLLVAATHPTVADVLTFVLSGMAVLAGAVGVVASRNPVHAALSLVMTLFGVAVLFVEQNANFLAVVQVIVYAGAIVVLFLFVIMFLGVDRRENVEVEPLKGQRPLALFLIAAAVALVLALAASAHWVTGAHAVTGPTSSGNTNIFRLGRAIFTTYLWAFEITAGLLVIAVVGAVVLSRRPPTTPEEDPEIRAAAWGTAPDDGTGPPVPGDGGTPAGEAEPMAAGSSAPSGGEAGSSAPGQAAPDREAVR